MTRWARFIRISAFRTGGAADPLALQVVEAMQNRLRELAGRHRRRHCAAFDPRFTDALANLRRYRCGVRHPLTRLSAYCTRWRINLRTEGCRASHCSVGAKWHRESCWRLSSDTERTQRLARRVALDIQRIVEGDDASASRFLSERRAPRCPHAHSTAHGFPALDDLTDASSAASEEGQGQLPITLLQR